MSSGNFSWAPSPVEFGGGSVHAADTTPSGATDTNLYKIFVARHAPDTRGGLNGLRACGALCKPTMENDHKQVCQNDNGG
jgi:hypothetical protein